MQTRFLAQPCRNFNILGSLALRDPKDGREKVVLSNYATREIGSLIFVEPASGDGELLPLPGDEGAWALLNLDNERLLVGTCETFGYVLALDLRTRRWASPLRIASENYVWNFCRGDDGLVYAGTYPGCLLLRYDPARHTLDSVGRASDHPDNQYSRSVFRLPGRILVECQMAASHLAVYDLATQRMQRFGPPGARVKEITDRWLCVAEGERLAWYDPATLAPPADARDLAPAPVWQPPLPGSGLPTLLQDGRRLVERGQEYYLVATEPSVPPVLKPIPAEAPATGILTIVSDAQGRIWGASNFGQTIFSYDPPTGRFWNSPVVCDRGGEVYGMAFARGRLFLSAYCGGDHVVYDPAQPWDQLNNRNPKTLETVRPALIRPHAKSVIGPDGHFWTGWMAAYGVYGGGLTRVDTGTGHMTCWRDPIPAQGLESLTADARDLYFTTTVAGCGLPDKTEARHFAVWSPEGRVVWEQAFDPAVRLGQVLAVGGRVLVQIGPRLGIFNPSSLTFERHLDVPVCGAPMVAWCDGQALVFGADRIWRVTPGTGVCEPVADAPAAVTCATVTPDGTIYFACESRLYRLV